MCWLVLSGVVKFALVGFCRHTFAAKNFSWPQAGGDLIEFKSEPDLVGAFSHPGDESGIGIEAEPPGDSSSGKLFF